MAPATDTTGQFLVSPISEGAPQIVQHIELEPLTRDSLISLSHPRLLQLPPEVFTTSAPPHHPHWIQIDAGGSLYQNLDHEGPLRYTVTSQPDALSPEPLSPDERLAYLQLPPDMSPRVRALAVGLTETLTTSDARAQAIFEYVTHNHTYTLNLPDRDSDPLDHFLFEDKQGHCEFFASAMVALLRLGGVPAREVLGFMGGDWNDFGNYYTVRQRDAHAWVEAYIDGRGWVMFDPTPPASRPDQRNVDGAGSWGGALMDHLQRLWGRWVVEFSLERQLGLLKSFVFGDAQRFELEAFGARLWAWMKDNALVGVSVLVLLVGWWRGVRRWRWRGKHLAVVWAVGAGVVWGFAPESGGGIWWFLVLVGPPMVLWRLRLLEVAPMGSVLSLKGEGEDRGQLQMFYDRLISALRQDLKVPADVLTLPPEALAQTLEQSADPARNAAAVFVREYAALRFGPPSESKTEQRAKLKTAWRKFQRPPRCDGATGARRARKRVGTTHHDVLRPRASARAHKIPSHDPSCTPRARGKAAPGFGVQRRWLGGRERGGAPSAQKTNSHTPINDPAPRNPTLHSQQPPKGCMNTLAQVLTARAGEMGSRAQRGGSAGRKR